ncbi:MAG: NAD(+) synthase [Planctomycetaceae bacterium]|nr:NAD(+) synthase [Planctomycetaceae bacterium]
MKLIKVASAVLNQTPLDWNGNRDRILDGISKASSQNVSLLCFPELSLTGYGCEDAFFSGDVHRIAEKVLLEIAPQTRGMIVAVGMPLVYRGALYNTACLLANGKIAGFVGKKHLAGTGIHYEPRWFKRWPENAQVEVEIGDESYPFGDIVFDCGDISIGFEICEDAWVADRVGNDLVQRGVDIILNPSASHFAFGKHEVRERFVLEGSRAFGVVYVYSNLVGNEAGRAIYDGGAMIASGGQMLAQGPRLTFADTDLTTATVDVESARLSRARDDSYEPDLANEENVSIDFEFPDCQPEPTAECPPSWEHSVHLKEEEFARAVALGLFDYLRKSRSRGYVVSLSGGADSAAVATLSALSMELGVAEIGLNEVQRKLAHISDIDQATNSHDLVNRLLVCVYQSTRNSSSITREAAHGVAQSVGAEFLEFDVDQLVQNYIGMVSGALGRELTWQQDDLALQNIQARARAPGVWLLANIRGALLLSTSNRSEAAVGYATMDGDTCGGLSPIAGIDKAFLRTWLQWMEETGLTGGGAIPTLSAINAQQPTAELRPPDSKQTDEEDLMPYDVLDEIERAAIRDKLGPRDIFQLLQARRSGTKSSQLLAWIERFFRLWSRNQWKRERYAPSFHLDDENLDPKTWCRFPILSGGFERELNELRSHVETGQVEKGQA